MRREQPSIRLRPFDRRKRLAWPASLQLSLVLAAPAFLTARGKASASAPPPEGCCDLRGAKDVIDARELSRCMACAGRSLLPPGLQREKAVRGLHSPAQGRRIDGCVPTALRLLV